MRYLVILAMMSALDPRSIASTDGMAKPPPPTSDENKMTAPAPDAIDPGLVKPAPPTEPGASGERGGAITSGVCMKKGKSTGAVTPKQCRDTGGAWHLTSSKTKSQSQTP